MKHLNNIKLLNENLKSKELPLKSGWFWVLIKGYDDPTPCWYMGPEKFYSYEEGDECFLPGGIGDISRNGIYIDDIEKIGPEIVVPIF
jgi:hypothetical protein